MVLYAHYLLEDKDNEKSNNLFFLSNLAVFISSV